MSWQDDLTPRVRQLQIIVGALTAGCLFFLAITLVVPMPGGPANGQVPLVTYVALAFAASALVLRVVVPNLIVSAGLRRIAPGDRGSPSRSSDGRENASPDEAELVRTLFGLLQTRTIVAGALLEGSAFFLLVAYLVERSPLALGAALALIIGLALHIPTVGGTAHWVEDQLAQVTGGGAP